MSNPIHQDMAAGRWYQMSICEQMGNIGSEVGRAINWEKKGNNIQKEKALDRALDLFDLTLADTRWRGPRLKELTRARGETADAFYGRNEFNTNKISLEKYFYQYAIVARSTCHPREICLPAGRAGDPVVCHSERA